MKPHTASGVGQLIARFLERLAACLLRLEASGETLAPADLTNWVVSADALVHGYVRMHTAEQLTRAGYFEAARAMRTYGVCSREPAVHIEHAQSCTSVTPADLLAQLNATIETFNRAEEIASVLARIILCALLYVSPDEDRPPFLALFSIRAVRKANRRKAGTGPTSIDPTGRGPPFWIPGLRPGQLFPGVHSARNSFPGARQRIRDPETTLHSRSALSPPIPDLIWDRRLRTSNGLDASTEEWTSAFAGVCGRELPSLSPAI